MSEDNRSAGSILSAGLLIITVLIYQNRVSILKMLEELAKLAFLLVQWCAIACLVVYGTYLTVTTIYQIIFGIRRWVMDMNQAMAAHAKLIAEMRKTIQSLEVRNNTRREEIDAIRAAVTALMPKTPTVEPAPKLANNQKVIEAAIQILE